MNISVHTRSRRWLLLLVVGAAAGLLAACGSSSSSSTSAASASSSGGQGGSRTTVAACLRRHGVTIPANAGAAGPSNGAPAGAPPSGGGPGAGAPPSGFSAGGANGAKLQAALKACGANVPGRGQVPKISRKSLQKYVSCVRQHGYQLPNPNFSGKGAVFPASVRGDKKFQGASRACQSLLSRAQPGTPAGA